MRRALAGLALILPACGEAATPRSERVLDFIAKKEDVSIHDAALKACEWFGIPVDEVKTSGSSHEKSDGTTEVRGGRPGSPLLHPRWSMMLQGARRSDGPARRHRSARSEERR